MPHITSARNMLHAHAACAPWYRQTLSCGVFARVSATHCIATQAGHTTSVRFAMPPPGLWIVGCDSSGVGLQRHAVHVFDDIL
jgi:hypothetical protein